MSEFSERSAVTRAASITTQQQPDWYSEYGETGRRAGQGDNRGGGNCHTQGGGDCQTRPVAHRDTPNELNFEADPGHERADWRAAHQAQRNQPLDVDSNGIHTVKYGETLWDIARRHLRDQQQPSSEQAIETEIKRITKINADAYPDLGKNEALVQPGWQLRINGCGDRQPAPAPATEVPPPHPHPRPHPPVDTQPTPPPADVRPMPVPTPVPRPVPYPTQGEYPPPVIYRQPTPVYRPPGAEYPYPIYGTPPFVGNNPNVGVSIGTRIGHGWLGVQIGGQNGFSISPGYQAYLGEFGVGGHERWHHHHDRDRDYNYGGIYNGNYPYNYNNYNYNYNYNPGQIVNPGYIIGQIFNQGQQNYGYEHRHHRQGW